MRRSASRRRQIPRLVGVLPVVAALTALTACDSGSGGSPKPPSSTSATLRPSSSPTSSPTVPSEARQPTRAGAAAFFRYFWGAYNHAYASMDSTLLRSISDSTCTSCLRISEGIDAASRRSEHAEGGVVTVSVALAADGEPTQGIMVNGVIDQTAGSNVSSDGHVNATATARTQQRVDAAVRWDGTAWRMMGLDILPVGQ